MKTTKPPLAGLSLVHVRAYIRLRYGKIESVVSHFRSWPRF